MGCCSSSAKPIAINVPVPEHGSGFLHWGDANCLTALDFLSRWYAEASTKDKRRFQRPYALYGPKPVDGMGVALPVEFVPDHVRQGGQDPVIVVTNTQGEIRDLAAKLGDRLRKAGAKPLPYRFNSETTRTVLHDPVMRRVHGALYMHLPLLVEGVRAGKVRFHGTLDEAWVNQHLPDALALPHRAMKVIVKVFRAINKSRSGGISLPEFLKWVGKLTPDDAEAESLFAEFVLLVNGRPQSPGHLNAHEFVLVVHSFLTMSHEEMMEHFFACMADTINEQGHLTINMRRIHHRYPKLRRASSVQHAGNEMLMTEFKNLAESRNIMLHRHLGIAEQPRKVKTKFKGGNIIRNPVRDKRFSAPVSRGFNPDQDLERHTIQQEGQLCTRRQFMELCEESHYIMGPMYMLQTAMHKRICGVEFWTARAMYIRQISGGSTRSRTRFLKRSVSRQMLHTQNSGYIRVARPTQEAIDRAIEGDDGIRNAPEPSAPPKVDPRHAPNPTPSAPPRRSVSPASPRRQPAQSAEQSASSGADLEGAGVGVAGGGESERKGAEVIDVVDVDDDDALTTAVQPVPAPPVDLTWNPKSDDDHLQTYVWIHKPDNSFVLREKLPGHVVDAEEVAAVLVEAEHDHSELNPVAGVEPLMGLGSRQSISHYPPLDPGMRQRRHTFHGMTKGHMPSPVHVTPLKSSASAAVMGKRGARRGSAEFADPRHLFGGDDLRIDDLDGNETEVHRHAKPVGPAAPKYADNEEEAAYYPPTWAGSQQG